MDEPRLNWMTSTDRNIDLQTTVGSGLENQTVVACRD